MRRRLPLVTALPAVALIEATGLAAAPAAGAPISPCGTPVAGPPDKDRNRPTARTYGSFGVTDIATGVPGRATVFVDLLSTADGSTGKVIDTSATPKKEKPITVKEAVQIGGPMVQIAC